MKKILVAVGLVIGILALGLLFRFGTLSPCGILVKELRSAALKNAPAAPARNRSEEEGHKLGMLLAGPVIDSFVGSMTTMQCTRTLLQLDFGGKNESQKNDSR